MKPIFSGYIKAHGFAIALVALTFGCKFAVDVLQIKPPLLDDAGGRINDNDVVRDRTNFRMRPLGQLVFSLVWVLAGTVFLVGLVLERKKTILPFATVFAIDYSVIVMNHFQQLDRKSFQDLLLSSVSAVLVVIPIYVGFTLAALYRLFELRSANKRDQLENEDDDDDDDVESGRRKPVKFTLGEEFDDSWIAYS